MDDIIIQTGKILLAEPFMMDANFRRAVILLCDHHEEGSLGFILNKPLKMSVDELIADFPEFDAEVHFGGPVATDTIHYIHDKGSLLEDSVEVDRGIFWGGNYEKLKVLVQSKLILKRNIRFFVGYSGWSSGQLKEEMDYGSWVTADMDSNYLFNSPPDNLWKQVMSNKGDTFGVISEMPDSLSWN